MKRGLIFSRILAVTGTVQVTVPVVFMLSASVIGSVSAGKLLFDYLIPAELFLLVLLGSVLLLWAALRSRSYVKPISFGLGAAVLCFFGGQALSVASGMASGAIKPEGPVWVVIMASLILYDLLVAALGVSGALLIKKLYTNL